MFKMLAVGLTTLFVMQSGLVHAADAAAGKAAFDKNCAMCHGATGHSDTPAAAKLVPKPAPLAGTATPDNVLKDTILKGGAAVGKSPLMVPFASKLSDADVDNIIAFIHTLK